MLILLLYVTALNLRLEESSFTSASNIQLLFITQYDTAVYLGMTLVVSGQFQYFDTHTAKRNCEDQKKIPQLD